MALRALLAAHPVMVEVVPGREYLKLLQAVEPDASSGPFLRASWALARAIVYRRIDNSCDFALEARRIAIECACPEVEAEACVELGLVLFRARRLDPPAYERLREISAPTRVLIGDQDLEDVQEVAARVAAQVRGAELIRMPGAGHMLQMEQPAEFTRLVLEFLER